MQYSPGHKIKIVVMHVLENLLNYLQQNQLPYVLLRYNEKVGPKELGQIFIIGWPC